MCCSLLRRALVGLLALGLAGCPETGTDEPANGGADAAGTTLDAGVPDAARPDAASTTDAGTAVPDAAVPVADAGVVLPDAAVAVPDASSPGADAGPRPPGQCAVNADCPTGPQGAMCSRTVPGGVCLACGSDVDCPGTTVCSEFGSCAQDCAEDSECPLGQECGLNGLCRAMTCVGGACPVPLFGCSGSNRCERQACNSQPDCPQGTTCTAGLCIEGP